MAMGDEDEPARVVEMDKRGLCGGDSFRKDNLNNERLVAQITARDVRRD